MSSNLRRIGVTTACRKWRLPFAVLTLLLFPALWTRSAEQLPPGLAEARAAQDLKVSHHDSQTHYCSDGLGTVRVTGNGLGCAVSSSQEITPSVYLPILLKAASPAPLTPAPTPTPSATATETETPGVTTTATPTLAPTDTDTPTSTPSVTATPTPSLTASQTPDAGPSVTPMPTGTATATPATGMGISGIQPSGSDETITIVNRGSTTQDLTGWSIQSYGGTTCQPVPDQIYSFPSGYMLAAGESVRVHSGASAVNSPPADLLWTTANMWNNSGDRGDLRAPGGEVVDSYGYGRCG